MNIQYDHVYKLTNNGQPYVYTWYCTVLYSTRENYVDTCTYHTYDVYSLYCTTACVTTTIKHSTAPSGKLAVQQQVHSLLAACICLHPCLDLKGPTVHCIDP